MSIAWWYANRAAGLVAWALLAGSLVLGLLTSTKILGRRVRVNWLTDLHRGVSGLACAFVGVHIAAAIADSYIHFGAADVLVPFASSWRPVAIAWGIVTGYLLVAVEATSLLRRRIPKATWRKIHYLSFPLFVTATLHGVTAGTELGTTTGVAVAALVTAAIAGLTVVRINDERRKHGQQPTPDGPARRIPARPVLDRGPVPATPPLAPPAHARTEVPAGSRF